MLAFFYLLGAVSAAAAADCAGAASSAQCPGSGELTIIERNASVVLCSAGFEYDPDQECCVMEEVTDPRLACDVGEMHGDVCAVYSRPQASCPEGFTLESAGCVMRSKNTMSTRCEAGYLDGASCVDRVPVELDFVCPPGSQERDGQCFTTQKFQHTYFCPAGWTRHGDRCVLEEIVDCTDSSLPGDCGEHCYVDMQCTGGSDCFASKAEIEQRLQSRKRRSLSAASTAAALCNSRPCEVRKMAPRPREESMEVISRTCVKRMETDADVFCDGPPSAVFTGVECCVQVPVDFVPECPAEGTVDDCYSTVRKPASATCPAGFKRVCRGDSVFSCQCEKEEIVEPEPLCVAGFFEDGKCVVFKEATAYCAERDSTLIGDICVRTVREPIRLRTEIVVECEGHECFEKIDDVDIEGVSSESAGHYEQIQPVAPVVESSVVGSQVGINDPLNIEVVLTRESRRGGKRARKAERKAIRKARRCEKKQCRRQRRRRCDDCNGEFEIVDEL